MAYGRKTGGRRKGTPNRAAQAVADRLDALGCDPIAGMARIAMDENNDVSLRAQMYKELAQYVAPKRKAVELTGEDGDPLRMELKSLIEEIQNTPSIPPSARNRPPTSTAL